MKFIGRLFLCGVTVLAFAQATFAVTPSLATTKLTVNGATCSGTVVAPSVILSAGHCFEDEEAAELGFPNLPPIEMMVDGYKVKIAAVVFDDNDHALVKVDFVFLNRAQLGVRPDVGAHVHYWGNPDGITNVYREGYVTSYRHSEMVMDANGFFGDSGAGIFDESGKVVGVMSYLNTARYHGLTFKLMGAIPLEFTPLQYSMMRVTAP